MKYENADNIFPEKLLIEIRRFMDEKPQFRTVAFYFIGSCFALFILENDTKNFQ